MAENQEMAGEDASLDEAVSKIMGIGTEKWAQDTTKLDRLEPNDTDITDADGTTDLDKIEADSASEDEDKGDGEDAAAGGEPATFLELPPDEEGKEPERIPLAEAAELIKQARQFNGDIATAVTRVEEEAYAKQDAALGEISKTFQVVRENARTTLAAMKAYLPQPPDPIMLDRNGGYYDPEGYHNAKIHYDNFVAYEAQIKAKLEDAEKGLSVTQQHQAQEFARREEAKLARFIPEWKDEKAREARKSEILDVLNKRYGVTKDELDDIVDAKAWRMMNDLAKLAKAEQKAPEVRKAVQEKAPKLVNGRPPPAERDSKGRFVNEARDKLRKTGSEDDFANYLLRTGATRRK